MTTWALILLFAFSGRNTPIATAVLPMADKWTCEIGQRAATQEFGDRLLKAVCVRTGYEAPKP